jgi:hypothetical protein
MFSLVLAANLFSDQVRNAFDPRLAHTAADTPTDHRTSATQGGQ